MTDSPEKKNLAERAADLSDAMFESSEARRRDAMQAVRAFVDTVDGAIPNVVDPSMRKKIIDSALELADKLGATQLEFLRNVSGSVSEALTPRSPGSSPPSQEVRAMQREVSDKGRR